MRMITFLVAMAALVVPSAGRSADKGSAPVPAATADPTFRPHPTCYAAGMIASTISRAKASSGAGSISVAADGFGGTLGIGCDVRLSPRFAVGLLGRADLAEVKARIDDGQLSLGWSWTGGARLGYYINPTVMVYGMAGVTSQEFKADFSKDRLGIVYGIGTEIALTSSSALILEWTRSDLKRWSVGDVSIAPEIDIVRLGIAIKL